MWQKIEFCIVAALAFSIPITWRLSVLLLVAWLVSAVCRTVAGGKSAVGRGTGKCRWFFLLFSGLYVMYCVSMFYTQNLAEGWSVLEKMLSLIVVPLMFFLLDMSYLDRKAVRLILYSFTISVFAVACADMVSAGIDVVFGHAPMSRFFSSSLSSEHHTYISMYACVGIIFCLDELIERRKQFPNWAKATLLVFLAVFTVFTVLLESRAGVLCMAAVYLFMFLWMVFGKHMYRTGMVIGIASALGIAILLLTMPRVTDRFRATAESVFSEQKTEDVRITILRSTMQVAADNWTTGVGAGDKIDAYMEQYRKDGNTVSLERKYNSHNQFVDTLTSTGIVGLLLLLSFFVVPLALAIRHRQFDSTFAMFLFMFFFNALFESVLGLQAGVLFFAFLFFLLFYDSFVHDNSQEPTSKDN